VLEEGGEGIVSQPFYSLVWSHIVVLVVFVFGPGAAHRAIIDEFVTICASLLALDAYARLIH